MPYLVKREAYLARKNQPQRTPRDTESIELQVAGCESKKSNISAVLLGSLPWDALRHYGLRTP